MSLRATVIFVVGLAFVRLAGKRVFGRWAALDIIVSVVIGSNLSRAITGNAPIVPVLCATAAILFLHGVLAHIAVWLPRFGEWLKGAPEPLIHDGEIDQVAMRRNAIGNGDLAQALRLAGRLDAGGVQAAFLERDGHISVIRD
jgi:uncharacterized membrane protein YcaP (DUF421 family)